MTEDRQIKELKELMERVLKLLEDGQTVRSPVTGAIQTGGFYGRSARDRRRVHGTSVGQVAYDHLNRLEAYSATQMSLAESYDLRKPVYEDKVRGSGALFGQGSESGKILQRLVAYEQPSRACDPVTLTRTGLRAALLYEHYVLGEPRREDPEGYIEKFLATVT